MVERQRDPDFNSHNKRGKPFPNLNGHPNGLLDPDTPVERIKEYLLNPNVYGHRPQGRSRNSGPRPR